MTATLSKTELARTALVGLLSDIAKLVDTASPEIIDEDIASAVEIIGCANTNTNRARVRASLEDYLFAEHAAESFLNDPSYAYWIYVDDSTLRANLLSHEVEYYRNAFLADMDVCMNDMLALMSV